ncbi:acetyl/propionyl/methylcrotonyl-CoA carboxylase subunit alpha [Calditrichota bacterium]
MDRIDKILVANRGEIAVRIIRSCHELGIATVAVYSDVDATAMHVREAGEAVHIGAAPPGESYLVHARILEAARQTGAKGIHPGYGFLAENAAFAQAVMDAGLIWIGPPPHAISLLGNKVESRNTMAAAGIPLVEGTEAGAQLDPKSLQKAADKIGYPVLIKAAAGGGGKGMRVVDDPAEFTKSLEAAQREAGSAFGDATVFVEKYVVEPRHIEFQIFGDTHGNRIHLFERECSIQRRHQKIIEETPSIALDDDLRSRMGETAVKVGEAAGYFSAGTVEFLLDKDKKFYFLEVNTRIQVEHPVTEETVGVDLVAEQIRVAMGAELSWKQDELRQQGHAIECRIYAEDAAAGFLPAAGPVHFLKKPDGPGVRWDGGVETGDEVSVNYDPIIAKLITRASDRETAIRKMRLALDDTVIFGLTTNQEFLKACLDHPEFMKGNTLTSFIPQFLPDWQNPEADSETLHLALTLAALTQEASVAASNRSKGGIPEPWQTLGNWSIGSKGA